MNVLVVAPHPDDESIGCGGTLCLHRVGGDRVTVVFLTSGELGLRTLPKAEAWRVREREAEDAAEILGVASVAFLRQPDGDAGSHVPEAAESLARILRQEVPERVYLTGECDRHPDHRAAMPIVETAVAISGNPAPALLNYEVLTILGEYDRLENISTVMPRKLTAIRAHRSQVRQFRYDRAARTLNEHRATVAEAGRYAEVFRFADGRADAVPRSRRADPGWYRVYGLTQEIAAVIPPHERFILVDDGNLDADALLAPRQCIPFLEKDGSYWGRPADDATAIRELIRLRLAGANYMVFAWPALWWLDYYSGLNNYLSSQFLCVSRSSSLIAFDLNGRPDSEASV